MMVHELESSRYPNIFKQILIVLCATEYLTWVNRKEYIGLLVLFDISLQKK